MGCFYIERYNEQFKSVAETALERSPRVLDTGTGREWGDSQAERYGLDGAAIDEVTIDVRPEPYPHALADLSTLPFDADRFGVAFCESVLEHVTPVDKLGPAVRELHRVLVPGGVLAGWVPFCYHFHGGSFADGNRFTYDGVERLLDDFSAVHIQPCGGPISVVLNAVLRHRDSPRRYVEPVETRLLDRLPGAGRRETDRKRNAVGYRFFAVK